MSLDWGVFSIALSDVATGKFLTASIMYDLVQQLNLLNSLALFHDGSQAMTADLDMGGNNINNVADISLNTLKIAELTFNDGTTQSTAGGGESMILPAFLGGRFTSDAITGVDDSSADFINDGVKVGDLVNVPDVYNDLFFQ